MIKVQVVRGIRGCCAVGGFLWLLRRRNRNQQRTSAFRVCMYIFLSFFFLRFFPFHARLPFFFGPCGPSRCRWNTQRLVVAFRGSVGTKHWMDNLRYLRVWEPLDEGVRRTPRFLICLVGGRTTLAGALVAPAMQCPWTVPWTIPWYVTCEGAKNVTGCVFEQQRTRRLR